ncbi:MAG TPA: D-alanyl-D-alanine carboxypeptidase family protein [Terriglobia bacterium]|nr:D-alanyl-D-alanine carboxypeptidase family protein [Terriglobia bacterium]
MTIASCRAAVAASFLAVGLLATTAAGTAALADSPDTDAEHAYIVDFQTGAVILDKKGDERIPPASTSKLMTIYLLFDALKRGDIKLTDKFHVSKKAWSTQGSKMFVEINSDIAVEDLIRGIIIQSGNDACVVVAEGMAGSEEAFAERMTAKAKELGMNGSHFVDASGLPDPEQYMTAHDLEILARHLITDFPDYYHYFSEKEFVWHGIKQGNRNPLLYRTGSGVDGLKTGHTEESGFSLVASAVRDNRRIIMVAQGLASMQNRADAGGDLLDWAFRETANYTVATKGAILAEAPVWMGKAPTVPLTVPSDLIATLPRAAKSKITAKAVFDGPLQAPIAAGREVGKLVISSPDHPDFEAPLVAAADVPEKSLPARMWTKLNYLVFGGS